MIVHDIVPLLFPEYRGKFSDRIRTWLTASAIRTADRIVAVSGTTKRDLASELGISDDRVSVAYPDCPPRFRLPVSGGDLDRVLRKYGLSPGYIYHGGGLEIRKNTEILLRAYAKLLAERDDLPPLVVSGRVHGSRNPLATDIEGSIERLGLADHVKTLGFVPEEDLPALYRGASFFAFPSLYEGFGIPLLEAFAVGTPVLAGDDSGSVPEIAEGAALLIGVRDASAVATGLERLLDDTSFREMLAERGRERVKDFSWDSFAGMILSEAVSGSVLSSADQ
jgi:alpha-1,3-rhamnosyl/mannosyltransferase